VANTLHQCVLHPWVCLSACLIFGSVSVTLSQAAQVGGAVIFIDELDAVGKSRSGAMQVMSLLLYSPYRS